MDPSSMAIRAPTAPRFGLSRSSGLPQPTVGNVVERREGGSPTQASITSRGTTSSTGSAPLAAQRSAGLIG